MKKLLIFLFPLSLMAQNYSLPNVNSGFPATARQIPWVAGSDIWNSGALPNYTGVAASGVACDGVTDDTAAINADIAAASSGTAVLLPASSVCFVGGIIRLSNNVALRGGGGAAGGPPFAPASPGTKTMIKLGTGGRLDTQNWSFSGSIFPTTSFQTLPSTCALSGTPTKGDTTLTLGTVSGGCVLSVGSWIKVFGNDDPSLISTVGEDGWCGYCGDNDGFYVMQQFEQVLSFVSGTGGSGSVINLSKPLYFTPDTTSRTVYGVGGNATVTEPAGAKYNVWTPTTTKAGYENLVVNASSNDIGSNPIIRLQGCLYCWVKGVETYDTGSNSESAHVKLEESYGDEIRDSAFHDQRSGASGSGYGVYLEWANGDHKVENNIFFHNRHWIVYQGGGTGTAILYNYADDGYTDDLTYLGSGRTSHGAHPLFNLFEGNIASHLVADEFIGTSSNDVMFRNWFWGGETNTIYSGGSGIPSFPPNTGFNGIDLYEGQGYYSFVNNVLGTGSPSPNPSGGIWGTWSAATLSGYNRSSTNSAPTVYSYGAGTIVCPSCNPANLNVTVPNSSTTIIRQGNYDFKTAGVAFNDGGVGFTYQASYYYASEPSFIGTCSWPAQGSDLTPVSTLSMPAYNRALGLTCSAPSTGSTTVSGLVKFSGTVKVQ